jgi:F-type H+-transporting ATPase subunit b
MMGALGINAGYLVSQIANLFILLVLLRIFLFKPVLQMLDQRAAKIRQAALDAESASQRAAQSEAEYKKRVEQAHQEARAILDQANEEAKRLRDQALTDARQEAQELLERARKEIELERRQASRADRAQLADLVVAAASKVIGQTLDKQSHQQLIERFLADGTASR